MAGAKSVLIVSSVHNQRVEAMNRNIRERVLDPFLDCFTGLRNEGFLNLSSNVHMILLKVTFKDMLFDVMNTFVEYWNNHTMRVNKDNPDSPALSLVQYQCLHGLQRDVNT